MTDEEKLQDQLADLRKQIEELQKLDLDANLDVAAPAKTRASGKTRKDYRPDWVKEFDRKNATGTVKHVVKTEEGKTELLEPITTTKHRRNQETGEIEEIVVEAGLPEHLKLGVLHSDRDAIKWKERPTHDGVAPRDLSPREREDWLKRNPGKPLPKDLEGPIKPVRKQMERLGKVWKYRNFKKCANCEAFDTWEARFDPYVKGAHLVHAEVWCHTCGSVDFEVTENMPTNIGTWAPRKDTPKEQKLREQRRQYRWAIALTALSHGPMTDWELLKYFRDREKYEAVDIHIVQIQLKQMQEKRLVVLRDGKWWNPEDYSTRNQK